MNIPEPNWYLLSQDIKHSLCLGLLALSTLPVFLFITEITTTTCSSSIEALGHKCSSQSFTYSNSCFCNILMSGIFSELTKHEECLAAEICSADMLKG